MKTPQFVRTGKTFRLYYHYNALLFNYSIFSLLFSGNLINQPKKKKKFELTYMFQIIFYIKDNGFILHLEREVMGFPTVDVVKKNIEGGGRSLAYANALEGAGLFLQMLR